MGINDKITPKRNYLLLGLTLSVIVHVIFFGWKYRQSEPSRFTEPEKTIEITQVPPEAAAHNRTKKIPLPEKKLEMAETEDAKNREIDPKTAILSEHNQTVAKQTRAKATDDFRKKQGSGLKSDRSDKVAFVPPTGEKNRSEAEQKKAENIGEGVLEPAAPKPEDKVSGVKRDWKTLSLKDLSVPQADGGVTAATDDRLKNVDTGENTMLSTREYRYFSYYHRIKELLRQYWKPNVERELGKLWGKGRSIHDDEMITKVLVLLSPSGQIQKISRVASSGIVELDQAAVEAFKRAAPFPNPPKGIIEADGFVRIQWDFILKTEAAPRIQFRGAAGAPN